MNAPPSDNPYRAPAEAEFAERCPPAVTLAMVLWLWFFSLLCGLMLSVTIMATLRSQLDGAGLFAMAIETGLVLFFAACARGAMSVRSRRRPSP